MKALIFAVSLTGLLLACGTTSTERTDAAVDTMSTEPVAIIMSVGGVT